MSLADTPLMNRAATIIVGLIAAVGLSQPSLARFQADLATSQWTSVAGTDACHLIHEIPRFGTIIVTQHGDLTFDGVLVTRRPPPTERRGTVVAVSPAWKAVRTQRTLPSVQASRSLNTVRFDERAVRSLVGGLEQGDVIVLRFADWAGGDLEAALSPVGFRPALRRHLECLATGATAGDTAPSSDGNRRAQPGTSEAASTAAPSGASLIATGGDSVTAEETADGAVRTVAAVAGVTAGTAPVLIHFAHDNARLDRIDLDAIAGIARRLRAGAAWNRIVVAGHTDATGRPSYNQALGLARALEVRNRLVGLGIDAERIEVRTGAASQPVASNDTDYGRAVNRRVEVRGDL